MKDTICAISTAPGKGAIILIKVSGDDAIKIVNKIFITKDLENEKTHTIHYGFLKDEKKLLDEVMVSIMKAPKTFTKEDVVEINIHGSMVIANEVITSLIKNGCRMAEPGEFTKRAFLNGRINLPEAEAVMDLIESKTKASKNLALNNVSGKFTKMINELKKDLMRITTNIAVNIDYPEYEDEVEVTNNLLKEGIKNYKEKLKKILKEAETGKIIKEGIDTVILGSPNVGKSSILNSLLGEEKAIVTDVPGTTRDIVEGTINIEGILLNIKDTAGIRKTRDDVEKIGVERSIKSIENAELVLYVINNNEPLNKEEIKRIENLKQKNLIVIINKVDLKRKIKLEEIEKYHPIFISAQKNLGFDELKKEITKMFNLEKIDLKDATYLTNARQVGIIENILEKIKEIEQAIKEKNPVDMIEIDIKEILKLLNEILGETYEDEVINAMFKNFCLGK